MAQPEGLLYSKEHEWTKLEGDLATVGITDYAQNSLGDIVYVELPRVGQVLTQHASVGVVESVKAVSELFTPVGGEVVEINGALEADAGLVNREPFGGRLALQSARRGCCGRARRASLTGRLRGAGRRRSALTRPRPA
jgi:glycine cleavage system H protein